MAVRRLASTGAAAAVLALRDARSRRRILLGRGGRILRGQVREVGDAVALDAEVVPATAATYEMCCFRDAGNVGSGNVHVASQSP